MSTISTNMISISMLNVCSLPSKLDLPDFIEFIESHTINCFVETKINEIDVDNLSIPAGYKAVFEIALVRLSETSDYLLGQVNNPLAVIRRTSGNLQQYFIFHYNFIIMQS